MILSYKQCIEKFGSDYQLKKEIKAGRIFQKEKGIYSDEKSVSELELIHQKYPRAIYTGESAYFYYDLTDVIPDYHVLATKREDSRIKDDMVRQVFVKDELFLVGKTTMDYRGTRINIYSKERLLIDLMRFKKKMPFDYYKEIIGNYRELTNNMDFFLIEAYAAMFRNGKRIMQDIHLEVL